MSKFSDAKADEAEDTRSRFPVLIARFRKENAKMQRKTILEASRRSIF